MLKKKYSYKTIKENHEWTRSYIRFIGENLHESEETILLKQAVWSTIWIASCTDDQLPLLYACLMNLKKPPKFLDKIFFKHLCIIGNDPRKTKFLKGKVFNDIVMKIMIDPLKCSVPFINAIKEYLKFNPARGWEYAQESYHEQYTLLCQDMMQFQRLLQ